MREGGKVIRPGLKPMTATLRTEVSICGLCFTPAPPQNPGMYSFDKIFFSLDTGKSFLLYVEMSFQKMFRLFFFSVCIIVEQSVLVEESA